MLFAYLQVAHKLSTVQSADLIIVVEAGAVIETGTHDQLVQLGGHYASKYRYIVIPTLTSSKESLVRNRITISQCIDSQQSSMR